MAAAEQNSFSKSEPIFGVFRSKGGYSPKGRSGGHTGGHTTPRRGQGWARAWARCGPPVGLLLFSFRLRESSGRKTPFIDLFRIFPKVEFLHIKKTPKQFC